VSQATGGTKEFVVTDAVSAEIAEMMKPLFTENVPKVPLKGLPDATHFGVVENTFFPIPEKPKCPVLTRTDVEYTSAVSVCT
jgi:hypothetical protein